MCARHFQHGTLSLSQIDNFAGEVPYEQYRLTGFGVPSH